MNLQVELKQVLPVQSGQGKNGMWYKCPIIVETQDRYPKTICVSVVGEERVKELGNYKVGDKLNIHINIASREYNGRWYTEVSAWKIDLVPEQSDMPPADNDFPADNEVIF